MGFRAKRETRLCSRPAMEGLEGRVVPATFHVSNAADLQADVAALSNSSVPNTIMVDPGVYNLTSTLQITDAENLTIVGKTDRSGSVTLLAPNGNRAFEIDGGNVTLSALTVAGGGGVDYGGGILAQNAVLTLKNATVTGNSAAVAGGGVYIVGGTLNVQSSSIVSNGTVGSTNSAGGGIGALNATVIITHGIVANNSAVSFNLDPAGTANASGAGIYAQGGTLTITNSSLAHNSVYAATTGTSATSLGGAGTTTNATATASSSTITGNGLIALSAGVNSTRGSAFSTNGGTLTITRSNLQGNLPSGTAEFDHPGATVVLKNTTVDGQKLIGNRTLSS
ncbi:MAG: hypothetical protein P4L84_14900 [Isosphaeraceae bacterium]|nr:hypothetical protein [Isosphaeraceae bacterium]